MAIVSARALNVCDPNFVSFAQEIDATDLLKLAKSQERTLKKTRLLAPKAEAELSRLEASGQPAAKATREDPSGKQQVDPEQAKAGFQKAIELAPDAVEEMDAAAHWRRQKDRPTAAQHAEAARKILEEIQQAQPKNEQNQDKQDKQDQQKNEDQRKDEDQKKEDQKLDEKKHQQTPQPQISQDRIEQALRKVRERQQEKRERDRKFKGQVIGRSPVDKDW